MARQQEVGTGGKWAVCPRPPCMPVARARLGPQSQKMIGVPSYAKKPPDCDDSRPSRTSSSALAVNSGVKSFSGRTFFWKGSLSGVSVVPGCKLTATTSRRLSSIAILRVAMLSAAFDMRYDHHPPSPLSPIEPTRAERFPMRAPLFSCFCSACVVRTGPIAFVASTRAILSGSIDARLRSGMIPVSVSCRTPATLSSRSMP
mmetsp:Transcript_49762/g.111882  ORF Transcript_49762/g.111882 Transcript_49762/m.111882 type:complete len:202 (+) Transcript_49762:256-861(+)